MKNMYPSSYFTCRVSTLLLLFFLVSPLLLIGQTTRYVTAVTSGTGDGLSWENASSNLQKMIFDSGEGDEVWVAKGTYYPTSYILIPGVNLTVQFFTGDLTFSLKKGVAVYGGFSGDESSIDERIFPIVENETILSGDVGSKNFAFDNSYHVVTALDAGGILDGFTIRDGYADNGDALDLPEIPHTNWGPLIRLFRNRGAGIHVLYTPSLLIRNVTVKTNTAYDTGGGIYIESSTVGIENSIIERNTAKLGESPFNVGNGGGITNNHATVTITNSLIRNNDALEFGGGVYNVSSTFSVSMTEIAGNRLSGLVSGGAGMCDVKTEGMIVKLDRVKFLDNNNANYGGGLLAFESDIDITNSLFARNNSLDWNGGSGIAFRKGNAKLTNCTITDNFSDPTSGTGLVVIEGNPPLIRNSIIWENRSGDYMGAVNANNSNNFINGHSPDFANYTGAELMVNPKPTNGSLPDYSLLSTSPALNLGKNSFLTNLDANTKDLAGNTRVYNYNSNGLLDIGAYEYQGNAIIRPNQQGVLYVKKGGTGNGTTWRNALGELADALKFAKTNSAVKQIWVAKGTYYPMYNASMVADNRNNTFLLVQGVSVFGGFAGTETTASQRTQILGSNATILSGDIGTANQKSDNCYHVVLATGINNLLSTAPRLEGFVIKGGNADGAGTITVTNNSDYSVEQNWGGGFYNHSSALQLENISFEANNAGSGGAIYNSSNKLAISNVLFTSNQASKNGGAVSTSSGLAISKSQFTSNNAGEHGGAIEVGYSTVFLLDSCSLSNNIALNTGGAVRIGVDATATFSHCDFTNNRAETHGGAIRAEGRSTPLLLSCNFTTNFAKINGGAFSGLDLSRSSAIELCHFTSNAADSNGGAVASSGSTGLNIWRSSFLNNNSKEYGGALYFSDNATSQVVDNSIFSKNNAATGGAVAVTDRSGVRFSNITAVKNECTYSTDYEGKGGGVYYDDNSTGAIVNSILWGNRARYPHNATDQVHKSGTGSIPLYFSTIENLHYGLVNFYPTVGNIESNPFFININDLIGADSLWFTKDDGLHLQNFSPALNMGSNQLVTQREPEVVDFAGLDRISEPTLGGIVDMGAYELVGPPSVRYIKQGGTGRGYSWEDAGPDIQVQINDPITRKIYIAAGTYYVTGTGLKLRDNLEIYGGYASTGIPDIMDRDWLTNETILHGNNERSVVKTTFGWNSTYTSSTVLDGFTLKGGNAPTGAGIYNVNGAPVYRNLKIVGNTATAGGGGIYDATSVATYQNVFVQGNTSPSGGGVLLYTSDASFTNSLISGNTANTNGGVHISFGKPSFTNVTISGNYRVEVFLNQSYPIFKNSIVWGDGLTVDYYSEQTGLDSTSSNNFVRGISSQNGDDDIQVANFFINPVSATANTPQTGGDYSLKQYSPAINKGLNSNFPNLDTTSLDLAGNARVYEFTNGGVIDAGAFEFQQNLLTFPEIRYVKQGASGSGASWADASGDLQATINQYGVKQVWVSKGAYTAPAGGLKLKKGVAVYGGFANSGSPAMTDRNWTTHLTTINGSGQGSVVNNKFTSANPLTLTAKLDGFVLSGGNSEKGGGIYNEHASPTLTNLTISQNNATDGGGIYNLNSSPNINHVTISNNTATAFGAGMYNSNSNLALVAVNLTGNSALNAGGGIYNISSTILLDSVSILDNQTNYQGGGITNFQSDIIMRQVAVKGNKSNSYGGGIFNNSSTISLINALVSGNTTGTSIYNFGGGIYNITSNFKLVNGTISGNYAGNGSGIYNEGTIPEIVNSLIWNNSTPSVNYKGTLHPDSKNNYIQGMEAQNGNVNYTASNFFANPVQASGSTASSSGNFKLTASSPAVNAGSNAAYTAAGRALTDLELDGKPRVYNLASSGIIDLGCYEFQGAATPIPGIRYVKSGSSGSGTSWTDASGNLQAMINAEGVLQVWVAKGTYLPTGDGLTLKNGVAIYGGFPNTGNPVFANRDWSLNETILDGNNERTVVYNKFTSGNQLTTTAILDGFTITKGFNTNTQANGYNSGGGFFNEFASPTLSNLLIKANSGGNGGGICNTSSSPLIKNTIITGNKGIQGAGISNNSLSSPKLINVLITGNAGPSGSKGGMSNQYSSSPELINVTISGNAGGAISQGIFNDAESHPIVRNSIIWGNATTVAPQYISAQSSNSLIQGLEGFEGNATFTTTDLFVSPALATTNNPTVEGNFRLKDGSPAINIGSNILFPELTESTLDLHKTARVYNFNNNGIIDAGAYEFQGERYSPNADGVLYVRKNGIGNGSSWTNPLSEVADALLFSKTHTNVKQIWVSGGTYKPAYSPADNNFGSSQGRDNAFLLVKDVKVYGGFAGNEASLIARDLSLTRNESVLSGDLDITGTANDARHVVIATGTLGEAALDGFKITGGNANDASNPLSSNSTTVTGNLGGGIYVQGTGTSDLVIENVVITKNAAASGGGMYLNASSPTIRNFILSENTASSNGGGIQNVSDSKPNLVSGYIEKNTAGGGGGGMYSSNSDPILSLMNIRGNTADVNGGGISNASGSLPVISNSLFTGNKATVSGGGIYSNNGSIVVVYNSTFAGNTAASGGALFTIQNNAKLEMHNSIVYGNSSGAVNGSGAATPVFSYSIVQGGNTSDGNVIDSNPLYVNNPGYANAPFTGGDFHLKSGSLATNSGDQKTNDTGYFIQSGANDLDGNSRILNHRIDLGPYEYDCTIAPASGTSAISIILSTGDNYLFNSCELLGIIKPTGDESIANSLFTAKSWQSTGTVTSGNKQYAGRYFELKPQNDSPSATAIVTLFFSRTDFETYNSSVSNASANPLPVAPGDDISNLFVAQFSGSTTVDGLPAPSASIKALITPSAVVWDNSLQLWKVTFSVSGFSTFFITTQQSALPVTLTRFEARKEDAGVTLNWQTASEINFSVFEVERSTDAKIFETIGEVRATGDGSTELVNYIFTDNPSVALSATYYYRLKMVDTNGSYRHSTIRAVTLNGKQDNWDAQVYPNPAHSGSVTLKIIGKKPDSIQLIDISGKNLTVPMKLIPEDGTAEFSINSLVNGTYLLQIRSGSSFISKKLIIAK